MTANGKIGMKIYSNELGHLNKMSIREILEK